MRKNEIMSIYKDMTNEENEYIGTDVWLTDGIHTHYIGMYTGIVGQYGTSTGWYRCFNATYDLYSVAEELFDVDANAIEIVSITLT